jgi:uncharacterized protein
MKHRKDSLFKRLVGMIVPQMPDFFAMLNEQCQLAVESAKALVLFLETGDEEAGKRVRELEHQGDELKYHNIEVLHRSFSTPIDREDLYRAMVSVDEVMNYAKATVREVQLLGIAPDDYMVQMGKLQLDGILALQNGFRLLVEYGEAAEKESLTARKTERRTEKIYRNALVGMFEEQRVKIEALQDMNEDKRFNKGFGIVIDTFKRREVYRHLSNAADHLASASEILRDIIIKTS